jgi:hypothetical protein
VLREGAARLVVGADEELHASVALALSFPAHALVSGRVTSQGGRRAARAKVFMCANKSRTRSNGASGARCRRAREGIDWRSEAGLVNWVIVIIAALVIGGTAAGTIWAVSSGGGGKRSSSSSNASNGQPEFNPATMPCSQLKANLDRATDVAMKDEFFSNTLPQLGPNAITDTQRLTDQFKAEVNRLCAKGGYQTPFNQALEAVKTYAREGGERPTAGATVGTGGATVGTAGATVGTAGATGGDNTGGDTTGGGTTGGDSTGGGTNGGGTTGGGTTGGGTTGGGTTGGGTTGGGTTGGGTTGGGTTGGGTTGGGTTGSGTTGGGN